MKDKKKIVSIFAIIFLLIMLGVIIVLILNKNKELKEKKPEIINEIYTGKINCTKEISQEKEYKAYILDGIEVKEDIVQKRNFLYKIEYLDEENYNGFKVNEKVENPIYDDKNLTIIYNRDEDVDLSVDKRDYKEFIQELEQEGYTCEKES